MARPAGRLIFERRPAWPAMLELLKPVTWFPPMWAFLCGIVASGASTAGHWALIFSGVILAGPLICGTSQAVNDWYDRHVDAINEPRRPIPLRSYARTVGSLYRRRLDRHFFDRRRITRQMGVGGIGARYGARMGVQRTAVSPQKKWLVG